MREESLTAIRAALEPDQRFYEDVVADDLTWQGNIFSAHLLDVALSDGSLGKREIVRHCGGAGVVAVDDEGRVCLVRQYRVAAGRMTVEIPAGKLDASEGAEICAARELAEETGLHAGRLEHLVSDCGSIGFTDEHTEVFLARDLVAGEADPDEGEFISALWIPLDDAVDFVLAGLIKDGKTVAGLLAAKVVLDRC
ncbi:NUDIX hydrolase [Paratractidigestivibacter sp.]|uniref:NUDIX hydrolase n=1 Tax=Paratractidigestivibacter sp. TaxID=2847316 RepID=UPI002ABD6880|nr:NUDIX hydrolase [Paratractidigestivibacter sp.]